MHAIARILVVGDAMLDHYVHGVVERISPEAPVPVLRVTREDFRPGGAANVAANIAALGDVEVSLCAPIADDPDGRTLLETLQSIKVLASARGSTPVKTRCIGPRGHQMLRIDSDAFPGHPVAVANLETDILVVSDYRKGAFVGDGAAALIQRARELGIPAFCDGKDAPTAYSGAYVLKMTAAEMAGFDPVALTLEGGIEHVIVTNEHHPVEWWSEGCVLHIPVTPVEVADVSGAGDTFLAGLVVATAEGKDMAQAIQFAAAAARVAVAKRGTAIVTRSEVE